MAAHVHTMNSGQAGQGRSTITLLGRKPLALTQLVASTMPQLTPGASPPPHSAHHPVNQPGRPQSTTAPNPTARPGQSSSHPQPPSLPSHTSTFPAAPPPQQQPRHSQHPPQLTHQHQHQSHQQHQHENQHRNHQHQHDQGCERQSSPPPQLPFCPLEWRIDKDESASIFSSMRGSLLQIFATPGGGGSGDGCSGGGGGGAAAVGDVCRSRAASAVRLRQLLVELQAPRQRRVGMSQACGSGAEANSYVAAASMRLNPDQQAAVLQVLGMQDYALLLGMPGTGKTTTIVHAIKALVAAGCSVLVSSYTHSAVDNILMKLAEGGEVPFVRVGAPGSVHPKIRPYLPGGDRHPDISVDGLKALAARVPVWGATCLAAHHSLLSRKHFDVVIVDEASQISLPASLGVLQLGRAFMLVGDHYQLAPLATNSEAEAGGYTTSLFRALCEAHPQAVVTLRRQYRMCAAVMSLSNALVYNGALLCGSGEVANARLHLPGFLLLQRRQRQQQHVQQQQARQHPAQPLGVAGQSAEPQDAQLPRHQTLEGDRPRPHTQHQTPSWLLDVLDPGQAVVFLDTDNVTGMAEQLQSDGLSNPGEAAMVVGVVAALLRAGLPASEVGVLSPYRTQVGLLLRTLRGTAAAAGVAAVPSTPAASNANPGSKPPALRASGGGVAECVGVDGGGDGSCPEQSGRHVGAPEVSVCPTSAASALSASFTPQHAESVEVLTIDKCQGRDKSAIIISMVRSNSRNEAGRLLADWRRINVALTRAKTKLVVVGSASTMASVPLMEELVGLLRDGGCVVGLPHDSLQQLDAMWGF
ncbi:MAG: hypothetical protein WDW36_008641 [Sanguina aurantia]